MGRTWITDMKKRILSLFLAVVLVVGVSISVYATSISGLRDKISEIEDNISSLEEESKQVDKDIEGLKGKIEQEKEKQKKLNKQKENANKQVVLYETKIAIVEDNIAKNKTQISDMKKSIEKNEKLFLKRVRAMYMSSQSSVLSAMLGAEDLADFLTRTEVLKRISEHDTQLIEKLTNEKEELVVLKKELEAKKTDLDTTKVKYEDKSKELQKLANFSEASEKEMKNLEKKYIQEKDKMKDEIAASEAAIDKALDDIRKKQIEEARIAREKAAAEAAANAANGNGNQGGGNYTGGDTVKPEGAFAWPVPGYAYISSGYGYRTLWGRKEFHYGIDIPAPSGTAIVAANDGVVVLATYSSGYGNYVVVDHGGGYMTLYAHASSLGVSAGQTVKRGQYIAGVGTTGPSTGNHLHFEVRVEGAKQNPLGFVNAPY